MSQRTATIDVDSDFAYHGEVTKSYVDAKTGKRIVQGVASGVAVDRDGERVSKNAIASMCRQINAGPGVKVVGGTHQQDWASEMGEVVKAHHDTEHDQLVIKCELPPAGEDSLADKAWTRMTKHGEKLSFSIGGKLRKAYFELNAELGKRVKVLDDIGIRHVALTKNPSSYEAFAEAVAKTFTEDPDTLEFTEHEDEVEKAATPNGEDSDTGDRNAGAAPEGNPKDADQPGNEAEEKDDEDTGTEPDAVRHLACPNCGHEFAAPLPEEDTETNPSQDLNAGDDDKTTDDRASKIAQENDPMDDTLKMLKDLVGEEEAAVEKTEATEPAATEVEVEKTEDLTLDQVAKMTAASHRATNEAIATLTDKVNEVLGAVAKSIVAVNDRVESLPVGRKSRARILPPNSEVEKTATDADSVEKRIEEAPDALTALKIQNEAKYGIK